MVIWTPTGNIAQTEIDLMIESEQANLNQKEKMLQQYQHTAITLNQEKTILGRNLKTLRQHEVKAVALTEYKNLRAQMIQKRIRLDETIKIIEAIQNNIDHITKRIKALRCRRAQLATSILEFKPCISAKKNTD